MIPVLAGPRLDRTLGRLAEPLKRLGSKRAGLWLAGGAVRDAIRGGKAEDADLVVREGVLSTAREFARVVGGAVVPLGRSESGGESRLVRVIAERLQVDFTPPRASTIEEDLRRRDFTVNAMAVRVPWGGRAEVLDPAGGANDLKRGILRTCSGRSFRDDPVRLWRAHREAVELGLRVEADTARQIRRDARLAREATAERLRDEVFKLLSGSAGAAVLGRLLKAGVLTATFPALKPMTRVRLGRRTYLDVMKHTLETMRCLEGALAVAIRRRDREGVEIARHLAEEPVPGRSRRALMLLAALFHDVGKPRTVSTSKDGNVHFFGHDSLGASLSASVTRDRLRCAESEVRIIARLTSLHLRPGYLAAAPLVSERAIYRFLRDAGDELFELLLLARADRKATHHERAVSMRRQEATISRILAMRRKVQARTKTKRLITGHDVMREFKIKPGPQVGRLLRSVDEAQALGKVSTKKEAVRWARAALDGIRDTVID